jgi:orotidine-5'-phosphate decarboxylase
MVWIRILFYKIKIYTQDQRYSSPRAAVLERGADLVIVGRGISGALDPAAEAERYRQEAWQAYR